MSVLIDKNTRVVVQGITGREGSFHAQQMLDYEHESGCWGDARQRRNKTSRRAGV